MIDNINIQNFKSLKQISLDLKKLNILIGPNGSGKSSVLQAITFLKQLNDRQIQDAFTGPYINLISYKETIYKQDELRNLEFSFRFIPSKDELETINKRLKKLWNFNIENRIELSFLIQRNDFNAIKILADDSIVLNYLLDNQFHMNSDLIDIENITMNIDNRLLSPNFSGDNKKISTIRSILDPILSFLTERFSNLFSLPIARGMFQPQYPFTEKPLELIGEPFDQEGVRVANILTYMRVQPPFEEDLKKCRKWMSRYGVDIRPYLISNKQTKTEGYDSELDVWTNITHQGFGPNQLIPIILMGILTPKNSTLLIEEPEIHLHPRLQADIVDFFIEEIAQRGKQALITTHSEHVILRLQRRIAEGVITKDDVAFFYFTKDKEGSHIKEISIDENGRLLGDLSGFFEEGFQESFEHMQAIFGKGK